MLVIQIIHTLKNIMNSEERVKKQFILKLITKYFLYGYLCFLGILICGFASCFIYRNLEFPKKLFLFIFLFCCILLCGQFLRIVISTNHKFRYYRISLYRLKTRGYKDSYFECEMHEPCFRLIIKDLLVTNGYKKQYYKLKEKCRGKNLRVERAKEKLLEKVIKKHNENGI